MYDVIFQNCTLELNTKNDWGYTPIELARKDPYRANLLKRMTEWMALKLKPLLMQSVCFPRKYPKVIDEQVFYVLYYILLS